MPPQSLASAHSAEVWTLLGASVSVIISLIALIYSRINKDIKTVADDVDDVHDKCEDLDRLFQAKYEAVHDAINTVREHSTQVATHQVFFNNDYEQLKTEIADLRARVLRMETEHALCFGEYKKRTNQ